MATYYEIIQTLSIDEMAQLFYHIVRQRDLEILKQLNDKGVQASLVELPAEVLIANHREFLERSVE